MKARATLIINATLQCPQGPKSGDLLIENEHILKVAPAGSISKTGYEILDAKGLLIIPGVIDTQVHFRWPGLTHKEDLASGSTAALLGGVTTYLEMPNTKPSTTDCLKLNEKIQQGLRDSRVDFGFFIGATRSNLEELINAETLEGCCGIKIFFGSSTGDLLLNNLPAIEEIFARTKSIIAIHSEDEEILQKNQAIKDRATHPREHEHWRNVESALRSTEKILAIAKKTGRRVHILHVTTAEEMDILAQHKKWATVEVTPQHLTLHAPDCYDRLGTFAQMNPPIRGKNHQDALWRAVQNGIVNVIGSDHAPHTREEKASPYPKSPSGMPGVQTMLPLMFHHALNKKLSLERMVDLLCHHPAELYSMHDRGAIVEGRLASLVALNPSLNSVITNSTQQSKVAWTPFDGMTLNGRISWVMHRGLMAVKDDNIIRPTSGKPIASTKLRQSIKGNI